MKKEVLIFVLLFAITQSFACKQIKEIIKYNKHTYYLEEVPLEQYYEKLGVRPKIFEDWGTSNCYKGYRGIWKIQGSK